MLIGEGVLLFGIHGRIDDGELTALADHIFGGDSTAQHRSPEVRIGRY